ncbi:glycosyltransferase [Streptococcus pluranimalium]|uniref:glycosyltransferase n=1 Tax=Streptococcus pluranimalium TaxID=82348 RepID=UPI003F6787D7
MNESVNKPIRILHMIGSLNIGGSQSLVMNLYRKIDKTKIQFDFIVDQEKELYFKDEIEALGGRIFFIPKFNGYNLFKIKELWKDFFLNHPEYKIFHVHIRSYSSLILPISKKYGLKIVIHSHSTSNGSGVESFFKSILQYPLRFEADYFLSCSMEAGKWLFGKNIIKKNNFTILKNGIDIDKFIVSDIERDMIRKQFGIKNEFVLGFLARVTKAKNPNFVLDVFYEYKKNDQNAKLLFIGDGDLLGEVKQRAKELHIFESIIFTGERTDVGRMFSVMDFYILPSLWEGLGISLIEAQASGTNSICSENIQDEAIITDSVLKMNLSLGAKEWANAIIKYKSIDKKENSNYIIKAGYDIESNTVIISKIYNDLLESIEVENENKITKY